jgi:hypothetical protein
MTGADRDPHARATATTASQKPLRIKCYAGTLKAWPQLDRDGRTGFALAFCVNPRHAPRGRHDLGI